MLPILVPLTLLLWITAFVWASYKGEHLIDELSVTVTGNHIQIETSNYFLLAAIVFTVVDALLAILVLVLLMFAFVLSLG